jgi:hypothetical protein
VAFPRIPYSVVQVPFALLRSFAAIAAIPIFLSPIFLSKFFPHSVFRGFCPSSAVAALPALRSSRLRCICPSENLGTPIVGLDAALLRLGCAGRLFVAVEEG